MPRFAVFCALLCSLSVLIAQQTSAAAATSSGQTAPGVAKQQAQAEQGLENPWEVRNILNGLIHDNESFKPLLAQMDPQQWYEKHGAPSTYILQRQAAQQELEDVVYTSKQLAQKTEDLTLALDEYFRLEALEITARSLQDAVQRYGDRVTATKLAELIAHNFDSRQRFRDYIRNLAISTQQNYKIADEEAQRCRGMISKEPPPASRRSKK